MNRILVILFFSFSLTGISQNTKISGTITNPKSDWVKLANYWWVPMDSVLLTDGAFSLSIQLDSAEHLLLFAGEEWVNLYMKPEDELHVELNTRFFDETIMFTGKGAKRNQAMNNYYLCNEFSQSELAKIANSYEKEDDTTRIYAEAIEIFKNQSELVSDYEKDYPELEPYIANMKAECSEDNAKFQARMAIENRKFEVLAVEAIGRQFTLLKGNTLKGKEIAISELYGKPMVVDFWATWCGPCISEVPAMQELEKKYEGKITFVSICGWSKEEKWKTMAEEFGFHHNIFLTKEDADAISKEYVISFIPRYMFLDANGKIISLSMSRPSMNMSETLDAYLLDN